MNFNAPKKNDIIPPETKSAIISAGSTATTTTQSVALLKLSTLIQNKRSELELIRRNHHHQLQSDVQLKIRECEKWLNIGRFVVYEQVYEDCMVEIIVNMIEEFWIKQFGQINKGTNISTSTTASSQSKRISFPTNSPLDTRTPPAKKQKSILSSDNFKFQIVNGGIREICDGDDKNDINKDQMVEQKTIKPHMIVPIEYVEADKSQTFQNAIQNGDVKFIQWSYENGFFLNEKRWDQDNYGTQFVTYCIQYGQYDILQWAYKNGCQIDVSTCNAAALHGKLDILIWARINGCVWDETTCSHAAENGHLHVLQFLRMNGCPWNATTCTKAAANKHLLVLKWARKNGCDWDIKTIYETAARLEHLDVLEYIQNNCMSWDTMITQNAAFNGNLAVLDLGRTNGCPMDISICRSAALGGQLNVLQWARKYGCPWDESVCSNAALGGHLAVLQWAKQHGCPWDVTTCYSAAKYGHCAILEWARAKDCPWDVFVLYICRNFKTTSSAQFFNWAKRNGCPTKVP